jgi:hypothetical protein
VRASQETPVLSTLIIDLGRARDEAQQHAADLHRLLRDLEALHEPDRNGDCPTCLAPAPCLSQLLLRGEIDLEQAYAVVRDHQPLDLAAVEESRCPPVPSLATLLATPAPGLDRFFDALLRQPARQPD